MEIGEQFSHQARLHPCLRQRLIANTAGGQRFTRATPASSPARRRLPGSGQSPGASFKKSRRGDGFRIVDDAEVRFVSKGDSTLAIPMRRIRVRRHDGQQNYPPDQRHGAAGRRGGRLLQEARWQIELLFGWIKQHLHIRNFLGRNPNAIRLQLHAAMIASHSPASRRARKPRQNPDHPLRRSRSPHGSSHVSHWQKSTNLPKPTLPKPLPNPQPANWPSPMSEFPRTALPQGGKAKEKEFTRVFSSSLPPCGGSAERSEADGGPRR